MAYAMYLRKSRADVEAEAHGEGETLIRHEQILLELAKKMNLSVTAIYREIVSGESIDARPEVQKLLAEVEQGMYEGVLVVDIDRLARGDTVDQGIVARTFRLSETKIITPKKVYDPTSEFDEEYFEFELFMARREYKIIARRIQRGRIASVKDGKFIGSTPPYGYDKVKIKNGKGYTLEPNSEAAAVKEIYRMYLNGEGMSCIANALDDLKIPTRSGRAWSKCTVSEILGNPVYIGKIRWSYRPDVKQSINGKITTKRIVNDNCYYVDGLHEPLVSEDDYNRVQEMRTNNRRAPLKQSCELQNPLTGLIYCKKCGRKMTRLAECAKNKYSTIKCTTRCCDCVSAPLYLVEEVTLEFLEKWLKKYKVQNKTQPAENDRKREQKKNALNGAKSEIEKTKQQIKKLYDLLEQGIYTPEIFLERNRELSSRIEDLNKIVTAAEKELEAMDKSEQMQSDIIPKIEKILETYNITESAQDRNDLLKSAIRRINYYKSTPNRRGQANNANFDIDVEIITAE